MVYMQTIQLIYQFGNCHKRNCILYVTRDCICCVYVLSSYLIVAIVLIWWQIIKTYIILQIILMHMCILLYVCDDQIHVMSYTWYKLFMIWYFGDYEQPAGATLLLHCSMDLIITHSVFYLVMWLTYLCLTIAPCEGLGFSIPSPFTFT